MASDRIDFVAFDASNSVEDAFAYNSFNGFDGVDVE